MERLPYIDEHSTRVPAARRRVWEALESYVRGLPGFAVAESVEGRRLALRGRHPFARYELAFELADAEDGFATQLRAQTHAAFPGPHGRLYRALVIGTRGHVLATKYLLRRIARRAA